MEKKLFSLLEANGRVIVPELGAFILRQRNPREVVFNDLLAFNDGMLSDHLENIDGLTREESQAVIVEFVENIKNNLSKGKEVTLEGLGTLSLENSGKIGFTEGAPDKKPESNEKSPVTKEAEPFKKETKPVKKEKKKTQTEVKKDSQKKKTPTKKKVPQKKKTPAEDKPVERESFVLEDKSTEVDVDASNDLPFGPDNEEPPFTIEKEPEAEPVQEARKNLSRTSPRSVRLCRQ